MLILLKLSYALFISALLSLFVCVGPRIPDGIPVMGYPFAGFDLKPRGTCTSLPDFTGGISDADVKPGIWEGSYGQFNPNTTITAVR